MRPSSYVPRSLAYCDIQEIQAEIFIGKRIIPSGSEKRIYIPHILPCIASFRECGSGIGAPCQYGHTVSRVARNGVAGGVFCLETFRMNLSSQRTVGTAHNCQDEISPILACRLNSVRPGFRSIILFLFRDKLKEVFHLKLSVETG